MFFRYLFVLGLLLSSQALSAQTPVDSFLYEGTMRTFRAYVPTTLPTNVSVPLILNLHGLGSNGLEQEFYANFAPVADTAGFIVVSPDGLNESWNIGILPGGPNDVGFLSTLIDSMYARYDIDLSRVYSTGMSNGGFMSYKLACELQDRIAAIASVTGSMIVPDFSTCQNERPVPIMEVHGTEDPTVPYTGSFGIASVPDVLNYWNGKNGCDTTVVDTFDFPDIVTTDSCTVQRIAYRSCNQQTEVVHLRVDGGGHSWPGAIPVPGLNPTNQDINASVLIWQFFLRHQHPNPSPATAIAPILDPTFTVFPNPAHHQLEIQWGLSSVRQIQILDMAGRTQWQTDLLAGQQTLRLSVDDWPAGMYLVRLAGTEGQISRKVVVEE